MTSPTFVDTHVHIYPQFDLRLVLQSASGGARRLLGNTCRRAILCVVDRRGFEFFPRLSDLAAREEEIGGSQFRQHTDRSIVSAVSEDFDVYFVSGRQWITAERIEVLGLGSPDCIGDFESADRIIDAVRRSGGLPVVPWSFGKWSGDRQKVVKSLAEKFGPSELAFGDIPMRAVTPSTSLLNQFFKDGYSILLGTDPLPQRGEELVLGSFGVEVSLKSDFHRSELVEALSIPSEVWRPIGGRQSLMCASRRWIYNALG